MNSSHTQKPYDYLFKFIVIGESGVGKSCIIKNYSQGVFAKSHNPTIGLEFASKTVQIEDKKIKAHLWDTAGQEGYRSLVKSFYRKAAAAIVVYDITDKISFQRVRRWIDDAKECGNEFMNFYLIGNKIDLEDRREVSYQEGYQLANELGMEFSEVSALKESNIEVPFNNIMNNILQKLKNKEIQPIEELGIKKWGLDNDNIVINPDEDSNNNGIISNIKQKCTC